MRAIERWSGLLAGVLGLVAVIFAATQHPTQVMTGSVIYRPINDSSPTVPYAIILPMTLVAVAALLACVAAVQDTQRDTARGLWMGLLVAATVLCLLSIYLLGAQSIWVNVGGTAPAYIGVVSISAAVLFIPATLAALISALASLRPRSHPAPALA